MEEDLKSINCIKDLAMELLDIFKDGVLARTVDGKSKSLTYRITKLRYWANKDNIVIDDINKFLEICNGYINNNANHYEVIGKLTQKGENIICSNRGG